MKALVLCAGFGRRLGQLCTDRPKPLLSLGRWTIVEHILLQLRLAGVEDVFINLHHCADQFEPHLGDGGRFGLRVAYVREPALLGTAGSVANIRGRLGGQPLLVHYGDVVMNHPLRDIASLHERRRAEATILLHRREGSNSRAWCDADGTIRRFEERPVGPLVGPERPWAYSGACVLSPETIDGLPERVPLDLPADVFPVLADRGGLLGQPVNGYRWAADSPARLQTARAGLAVATPQSPIPSHRATTLS